jgi:transcriptional regulator with XRE-family HTH domain
VFYDNFVALCASANKTPAYVGRELEIDKSTISCWKARKTNPSDVNAKKIANYFGVTVEELMGESKGEGIKKERPADGEAPAQDTLIQVVRNSKDRAFLLKVMDEVNKSMQKLQ